MLHSFKMKNPMLNFGLLSARVNIGANILHTISESSSATQKLKII